MEPNAGVLETPNDVVVLPNNGVDVDPNAGVLVDPNAGADDDPNAGAVVAPNVGIVDEPKVGVLAVPKAGWLAPNVVEPKGVLPNAGCVCWNVLPNGLDWPGVDPKPPNAGFWPNAEEPKEEDELPNAGVDDEPKAGVEVPKAGDEAPKGDVLDGAPKTPVDEPNGEAPVCEPNGFEAPNAGLGANGLVVELLLCPNPDGEPKGPPAACPKGFVEPNMTTE